MANRCLCCQKEVEGETRYHAKCLRQLFDKTWVPSIPFGIADLPEEVSKTAGKMSISGLQIKASVSLNVEKKKMEVAGEHGTHILKPEPAEYPELPQCENLCINIAEKLDMEVPAHGLFLMADKKLCYIIRRFDREPNGEKTHKEDMAQLLQKNPAEKYDASLEAVGKAILKFSKNKYLEATKFFERTILCFLTGNGDMHLKNWSLITPEDQQNKLAPCYDFVSSSIYLPNEEESALTLNGKRNNLQKTDFLALAEYLDFESQAANNALGRIVNSKDEILELVHSSELSEEKKIKLAQLIESRAKRLAV